MCSHFFFVNKLAFIIAVFLAIPFSAFLATSIYRVAYLPLLRKNAPRTSVLLAALGMSIAVESYLLITWGSERRVFPPSNLPKFLNVNSDYKGLSFWDAIFKNGVIRISNEHILAVYDLIIIIIFIAIAAVLIYLFKHNKYALAITATADSRLAARSCGINVDKTLGIAFFIGGAIASLGGTLFILRSKSLDPNAGFSLGVIAFVACVLGGIGSIKGSIAGAFLVSMVLSFAPAINIHKWAENSFPPSWFDWLPSLNLGDWSYGVIYVLMIITILFKPKGLFSK